MAGYKTHAKRTHGKSKARAKHHKHSRKDYIEPLSIEEWATVRWGEGRAICVPKKK